MCEVKNIKGRLCFCHKDEALTKEAGVEYNNILVKKYDDETIQLRFFTDEKVYSGNILTIFPDEREDVLRALMSDEERRDWEDMKEQKKLKGEMERMKERADAECLRIYYDHETKKWVVDTEE